jgi:hypothetical protein
MVTVSRTSKWRSLSVASNGKCRLWGSHHLQDPRGGLDPQFQDGVQVPTLALACKPSLPFDQIHPCENTHEPVSSMIFSFLGRLERLTSSERSDGQQWPGFSFILQR